MTHPDWLLNALHFFRNLDFFTDHTDLSDQALATQLTSQAKDSYWGKLEKTNPYQEHIPYYGELTLLALDKTRCIFIEDRGCYFKSPTDYYFKEDELQGD